MAEAVSGARSLQMRQRLVSKETLHWQSDPGLLTQG